MMSAHRGQTVDQNTPYRPLIAGVVRATYGVNVNHSVHSMLLAVHRRIAPLDIEGRSPRAGVV